MSTAANRKSHAVVLSSGVALFMALSLGLSADSRITTSDGGGLDQDYSGGQVARLINEAAPDWLAIPSRSSRPIARRIGSRETASRVVSYRTFASRPEISAFHKAKLAWKDMQWLDFMPQSGDHHSPLAVHLGHTSSGDERLQITIHDAGVLRFVEIVIASTGETETARLTQ